MSILLFIVESVLFERTKLDNKLINLLLCRTKKGH